MTVRPELGDDAVCLVCAVNQAHRPRAPSRRRNRQTPHPHDNRVLGRARGRIVEALWTRLILAAAACRSAVSSTITVTLPAPDGHGGRSACIGAVHIVLAAGDHEQHPPVSISAGSSPWKPGAGDHLHQVMVKPDLVELGMNVAQAVSRRLGTPLGEGESDDGVAAFQRVDDVVGGCGRRDWLTARLRRSTPIGRAISVMPRGRIIMRSRPGFRSA